ncbi:MAG: hypothetical protein JXR68_00855 [Bacteroidales bacterium]|nr:hypothetical protein [Bacteroidales bacterium]
MLKYIILIFIVFSAFLAESQTDTISYIKTINGYQFVYQDQELSLFKLSKIVKTCQDAKKEMNKAEFIWLSSYLFSYTGGYIVGYILGGALFGADINYELLAIGGGLVLVSIPLNLAISKHTLLAVQIFNKNSNYTHFYD